MLTFDNGCIGTAQPSKGPRLLLLVSVDQLMTV